MSKAKTPEEKAAKAQEKADKKAAAEKEPVNNVVSESEKNSPVNSASDQNVLSDSSGNNSDQNGLSDSSNGSSSDQNGLSDNSIKKVAVIIPYLKGKAQGLELLYAIRSISKNFTEENYQLVVIGDKEDWFSDDILFIEKPCIGSNPQADVIDKIKAILINESIPEEFVWTNDDIYFVAPTSIDELRLLKTDGKLEVIPGNTGTYNKNRERTIKLLERAGCPIRNFATHMPVVYEKDKMMDVFEAFPKDLEAGILLSSAYFNLHFPGAKTEKCNWKTDRWSLRVVSDLKSEEKKQLFRSLIAKKHFLNHSEAGFGKLLMDWLSRQFQEKCRFEK